MGIGTSIFLLAVGAILAFAVPNSNLGGVLNLSVVGWILMLAGVVGLILTTLVFGRRRRTVVERPAVVERPVAPTYERRVVDEGPDTY